VRLADGASPRPLKDFPMSAHTIVNAMTIDVEDYFQVSALAPHIARSDWPSRECRVEANIDLILGLLDEAGTKATFFTLGWIAERYPDVVRRIADGGHEVASHGYGHLRASDQSETEFLDDIVRAKRLLEDLCGREVRGYRAPSFSIGDGNRWAFDCLTKAGYLYSSSVYPVRHDHYGSPDAPRFKHTVGAITEIPPTTMRALDRNWPASGGGYFRFFPYPVSRWLIRRVNEQDQQSAVFYFHPWEVDPGQPRVPGIGLKTRFRHYVNLDRMEPRLRRLLQDFRWGRMDDIFLGDTARPASAGPN
jgi:polysaccharide deacetylase family protein (PEP-CTERM system associated)